MKLFFTSLNQNAHTAAPVTVAYRNLYDAEAQRVQDMLQENLQHDQHFSTNLSGEVFNFLQFTASMLCAFPAGLYMRKRIRKNKRLNYILQFKELLQVRNNIEKGSFAYDTLLFKQSPLQLLKK